METQIKTARASCWSSWKSPGLAPTYMEVGMDSAPVTSAPVSWAEVPGYPRWRVSSAGDVERGGEPCPIHVDSQGYEYFWAWDGSSRRFYVHSAVMLALVGPRPHKMEVRHLDGSKTNNALSNLRYGTHSENETDKVAHGTHRNARKTHCPQGHAYDEANTYWMGTYRYCRACNRVHVANRKARKLAEAASLVEGADQ